MMKKNKYNSIDGITKKRLKTLKCDFVNNITKNKAIRLKIY